MSANGNRVVHLVLVVSLLAFLIVVATKLLGSAELPVEPSASRASRSGPDVERSDAAALDGRTHLVVDGDTQELLVSIRAELERLSASMTALRRSLGESPGASSAELVDWDAAVEQAESEVVAQGVTEARLWLLMDVAMLRAEIDSYGPADEGRSTNERYRREAQVALEELRAVRTLTDLAEWRAAHRESLDRFPRR